MANVTHSNMTGAELHEPKGASTASAGDVYVADGAGSGSWVELVAEAGYTDLVAPIIGVNPAGGGVNDADLDVNDGTWLYNAGTVERGSTQIQLPHNWVAGTTVYPHVHWQKTTAAAGNVAWELSYDMAAPGGDFTGTYTSLGIITTTVAGTVDNNTVNRHLITATPAAGIDMTGMPISTVIKIIIERAATDVGDTYAADARLISFDVHYQQQGSGTVTEFA